MFFSEWWNALGGAAQVFYLIAIPSTLVLIIQTILMIIGMGEDADGVGEMYAEDPFDAADGIDVSDVDGVYGEDSISDMHDLAGFEGLRIFTVRGIIAFFVMFGWVGVLMTNAGVKLPITILVASASGIAVMIGIAYLLKAVMKLRSSGNTDNRNAVGASGRVHLTVPAARGGEGKVHVMLQGSLVERSAVTDSAEDIPTGSEVVVIAVSGQTDLVVKKK